MTILTVAPLVLLHVLRARDPFCVQLVWPLPAIAPVVVALMHGFFPALFSASLVLLWIAAYALINPGSPVALPDSSVIAGLLATVLVIAEFREREIRRSRQIKEELQQLALAEGRLRRANYLLTRSEGPQTPQAPPSQQPPPSLASALEQSVLEVQGAARFADYFAEANRRLLSLLAANLNVRSAAVYLAEHGRLATQALVSIGQEASLDASNAKVLHCLTSRQAATVAERSPLAEGVEDDSVLAAVPMEAPGGQLLGLLLIYDMPFQAFHDENVRMVWALASQLAELTWVESSRWLSAGRSTDSVRALRALGVR